MIYQGDYRDLLTKDLHIDAIITDPPYDLNYNIDDMFRPYCDGNILAFCKPENQYMRRVDEYLFWYKTPSTKNYKSRCGRFMEMILVSRSTTFNQLHWSQMTGVYDDRLIYPTEHPWQKPLSLMERLIRIYTNPGDIVFDPFMGSGTTGLACKNLDRQFIGAEIDPAYFKIAARKL